MQATQEIHPERENFTFKKRDCNRLRAFNRALLAYCTSYLDPTGGLRRATAKKRENTIAIERSVSESTPKEGEESEQAAKEEALANDSETR